MKTRRDLWRLHYQEYGDENASLVVFLHGGGVSSWMWDKQIRYFTHYYCLTIDLPEHGKSNELKPFQLNRVQNASLR